MSEKVKAEKRATIGGGLRWRRWATWRRPIQYLALLFFLYLVIATRQGFSLPVSLFLRLDPLVAWGAAMAGRTWLPQVLMSLITVALTLVLGRVWCGWFCPLGTVLDLVGGRRARGQAEDPGSPWRGLKYFLLLTMAVAALLGNLSLMILDPITIMVRTVSVVVLPGLNWAVTAAEVGLYRHAFLRGILGWVEATFRGNLLPFKQPFYQLNVLLGLLFVGILALNVFRPRFWCRYLCPLGALLGLFSKAALIKRWVGESCNQCQRCDRVCPTGTIDPDNGFASDPAECIMCFECQESCPQGATSFGWQPGIASWHSYDLSRRKFLAALGGGIAGVAVLHTESAAQGTNPYLLRPPGAEEDDLLSRCIRCGECMKVCPSFALHPALGQAGWEGFWTPLFVPRLGYCDYSCHACGQVCPTGAIPPLSLEEKRQAVIGKAYIDESRCLPWAEGIPCIVCEEMCPVPEKAIRLEEAEVVNPDGERVVMQQPHVVRRLCIGCGICENRCPASVEAAIRVRASDL